MTGPNEWNLQILRNSNNHLPSMRRTPEMIIRKPYPLKVKNPIDHRSDGLGLKKPQHILELFAGPYDHTAQYAQPMQRQKRCIWTMEAFPGAQGSGLVMWPIQ